MIHPWAGKLCLTTLREDPAKEVILLEKEKKAKGPFTAKDSPDDAETAPPLAAKGDEKTLVTRDNPDDVEEGNV